MAQTRFPPHSPPRTVVDLRKRRYMLGGRHQKGRTQRAIFGMKHTEDPYQKKADVTSLDADLRELRRSKYNQELADQARAWIFRLIDEPEPERDLIETLKSGVVLAKLSNALGGSVKYKESKFPFVQMENIANFLTFVKSYGVPEDELFQTIDLYEEGDIASVLQTIVSLSRYAHEKYSTIPVIGPKLSTKQPPRVPRKPAQLSSSSGHAWSSVEYGYMKGASQASEGVVFGKHRSVTGK